MTELIPLPVLKTFSILRSGLYFAESLPIALFSTMVMGNTREELKDPEKLKEFWKEINSLHESDIQNIKDDVYPISVLWPGTPRQHLGSLINFWSDGFRVAMRMRNKAHRDFDSSAKDLLSDLPEYYRRNFHFQTDGYMSESSAKRYDHQVDVLFSGAAGAMRRLILPPLKKALSVIDKPKILEIGCGPGSSTRYLAQTFPKAKITAVDLSAPYVKVAQGKLKSFPRVDALQADGADLPFKDGSFDAVASVFMFHELPRDVRLQVLKEAHRVLKPGGTLVIADSIQWNDHPTFNWALERFPTSYHEPFFKNYIQTPMRDLFVDAGFKTPQETYRLFTKVVWDQRSSE